MIVKKVGNLLEEHIEKVVLAVVGLVCIWLLLTRVVFSPNVVTYEKREFSPSEIDPYIRQQAQKVEFELKQSAVPGPAYEPQVAEFRAMMDSAIRRVNTNLFPPLPYYASTTMAARAPYKLPEIGDVTDVVVEHIRAAAYVPITPITPQNTYDKSNTEPNDIDLVTVEAKYNVAGLFEEFRRCFAGVDVPMEWRDPCLVNPVFGVVQLQRQELLQDGSWSGWQNVPRAVIDHRKQMFEIMQDTENLPPGGAKVQLLQFDNPDVRMDLLQPMAYQIASANVEWFPPSLHQKFEDLQKKEKLEEKRKALEDKKKEEERQPGQRRDDRRGGALATQPGGITRPGGLYPGVQGQDSQYGTSQRRPRSRSDRGTGSGVYDDTGLYGQPGLYGDRDRRPRSRSPDQRQGETDYLLINPQNIPTGPSTGDVYYEFQNVLITRMTDLSKLREPLLFWAHDDTVEPGKTYQYRIRLGVLNPVAGAGSQKSQAVLWSNFSEVTKPVPIPARLYFFANEIQVAAKTVTVKVAKYVLGYWHSQDFRVKPGEVIGKVVETEVPKTEDRLRDRRAILALGSPMPLPLQEKPVVPEKIDFDTKAVLVDAVAVNDWAGPGQLQPRFYHDMLYTYDGMDIEHMPIKPSNWPDRLLAVFYEIERARREPPQPFRAWDSKLAGAKRRPTSMEGYEGLEEEEYMMMMEDMMMRQPPPRR
jgi:hypothetical protein